MAAPASFIPMPLRFRPKSSISTPAATIPFMLDRLGKLLRNQDHVVVSCPRERREQWAFLLKSAGVYGEIRQRAGA